MEGEDGIVVKHLIDFDLQHKQDIQWMEELKALPKCFIVTKDNAIKKKSAEVEAWKQSGLTLVFLQHSWMKMDFWTISWKLITCWPEVKKEIQQPDDQCKYELTIHGKLILLERLGIGQ